MTSECLWCLQVYDLKDHYVCPSCAYNEHPKDIKIVVLKEEEK